MDAVAETRHVFLSGIEAPDCWLKKSRFVIGETGFGTGLNFLATWDLWRQTRAPSDRLYYISVDHAPLCVTELRKAHRSFPEFCRLSDQLCNAYPVRHPGYHQMTLEQGKLELLLLFGPVAEMLQGLMAEVDAWYLDGFSPSRNPDMWTDRVFSLVADRSTPTARVATYSTARQTRDGLKSAGFECEKVLGYAGKREALKGRLGRRASSDPTYPWFRRSSALPSGARVAIIGAGISGACMAAALSAAGADVTIVDRHAGPAGEASGNPAGLIQPRPGGGNPAYERLQTSAYLYALRTYDAIAGTGQPWIGQRGVLSFGRDRDFLARHCAWLDEGGLPKGYGTAVTQDVVSDIAGITLGEPATWFPQAGTIDPTAVCWALLDGMTAIYHRSVAHLQRSGNCWRLTDDKNRDIMEADAVVLANGFAASFLCPDCRLPLYGKRGQISYLTASEASKNLNVGLSYGGYMTPALKHIDNAYHVLGATYQQWRDFASNEWQNLSAADDQVNQNHIRNRLQQLEQMSSGTIRGGRASLRTTTTDHLPVVGPAFDGAAYGRDYADLRHGKPPRGYAPAVYTPGLFMISALGSRGFALAPLLAQLLTAEMMGTPLPVDEDVHNLLHPARFLVRELKRG